MKFCPAWLAFVLSVVVTFHSHYVTASSGDDDNNEVVVDQHLEEAKAIFHWLSGRKDGFVSSKQEVRRAVPGDPTSPLGIYALMPIAKGETLVSVPWDALIESDDPNDGHQMSCGTIRNLARELRLGNESEFAPYATYLNNEPRNQIPSGWSDRGRAFLDDVIIDGKIPPAESTIWFDSWVKQCDGDVDDEFATKALLMVIQRSDDSLVIPAYDSYNHRNGKWTNAGTEIVWDNKHITTATRDIEVGEEIYLSYFLCPHCEGRALGYGTAEMFRDYGFVEYYPQRWHYMEEDFQFDIDQKENGYLTLQWDAKNRPNPTDGKLMEECRAWFRTEIRRLRRIKNVDLDFAVDEVPKYELDAIWKFVDANVAAMTLALASLGPSPPPEKAVSTKGDIRTPSADDDDYDEMMMVFNVAPSGLNGTHYDPLNWEFDTLDYANPTCNNREIMRFRDFDPLEFTKTAYQSMTFVQKTSTDNVCMDLDNIVQICANYRPQYHEYVTHVAARFVKTVKRVIFIGGGDSMLLHEALRYPDVELVVGLELDQTVTRKCFKHFKSSPHFDDDRVEWWFGDATKSLLLLPEEYWGSFDLVLVDLSETVMSFSVTKELDVFDALALLLSPVGVMVKNEMYMEKFSRVFDYSMDVYYSTPVICSQVLAFGSNHVDFFHAPTYDHGIETLLYGNMHDPDTRYDLMHDYRKNIAPDSACNVEIPDEPTEQRTAAGICEIVNVENVSIEIDEKTVATILTTVATKVGFTIVSDPAHDSRMVLLVMEEGYIAARLWPSEKYVGLDINLWGSTYKVDTVRAELVMELGSSDVSSYRVVVGGMYGSSTWREDQKRLGPKLKQLRNCEKDVVTEGSLDTTLASDISIEESVVLTLDEEITAVVVCGESGTECSSVEVLTKHGSVEDVIVLRECPGLTGSKLEEQFACESKIAAEWEEALKKKGDLDRTTNLLVMDTSSSYKMHQIVSSILSSTARQEKYLADHSIVVTWSTDRDAETWRREFLDRLRKVVEYDPVSRAEIVFQAGGATSELGIVSTWNDESNYEFEKLEKRLRQRLPGITIELRNIHGGLFNFQHDWNPPVFTMSDYDDGSGKAQFDGQQPLGRQNIFQLVRAPEVKQEKDLDLNLTRIWICLKSAMSAVRMKMTLVRHYPDRVGDGGIIFAFSDKGNVVVVWDGREHIDLNFFTYGEMEGTPEKFSGAFLRKVDRKLHVGLRDDQPRGIGKVINFPSDLVEVPPSKRSSGKRTKRKVKRPVKRLVKRPVKGPDPKTSSDDDDDDDDDYKIPAERSSSDEL